MHFLEFGCFSDHTRLLEKSFRFWSHAIDNFQHNLFTWPIVHSELLLFSKISNMQVKNRDEKNINEKEESDGDGVDRDSEDTDQSGFGSGYSSDGSESDGAPEIDEEECMKRRQACIEQMSELEKQIVGLRDQIINEQLYQIDLKLTEVKNDEASEYLQPLAELKENMRIRSEVAGILREYRLKNLENQFEAEELATQQNLENEQNLLHDSVEEDLLEKIKNLEDDRNNVDLNADLWMVERGLSKCGKIKDKKYNRFKGGIYREFDSNPRRKPVTVSGPYIVYMLRDSEILEDWTIIKKALSNCNRKPGCR